jgi:putative membrane protein
MLLLVSKRYADLSRDENVFWCQFRHGGLYDSGMKEFLIRWFVTTLSVLGATWLIPGLSCDSNGALLGAALLLGIINALVRPVLLLLSLPFIIVTMGFFILVINALLILFVSKVIPGFHVAGFWTALFAGIVIGLISWILSSFFRSSDGHVYPVTHHPQIKQVQGRVVSED